MVVLSLQQQLLVGWPLAVSWLLVGGPHQGWYVAHGGLCWLLVLGQAGVVVLLGPLGQGLVVHSLGFQYQFPWAVLAVVVLVVPAGVGRRGLLLFPGLVLAAAGALLEGLCCEIG